MLTPDVVQLPPNICRARALASFSQLACIMATVISTQLSSSIIKYMLLCILPFLPIICWRWLPYRMSYLCMFLLVDCKPQLDKYLKSAVVLLHVKIIVFILFCFVSQLGIRSLNLPLKNRHFLLSYITEAMSIKKHTKTTTQERTVFLCHYDILSCFNTNMF